MSDNYSATELQEMKDRIRWIRKDSHLSQVEFAKRLNVSQSVISLIESGHASVSIDIMKRLSQEFDLSCDWLIYGRDRYVKLSAENHFIPLVDMAAEPRYIAKAGDTSYASNNLTLYKIPGYDNGEFRIFEVSGDSMMPSLHPHDKVIGEKLKDTSSLMEGSIYVVVNRKNVAVKRVYFSKKSPDMLIFKSDNQHYTEEKIPCSEVLEIWIVKAKITSSFVDQSYAQHERMNSLESDLNQIKEQVSLLVQKSSKAGQEPAEQEVDKAPAPAKDGQSPNFKLKKN